MRAAVLHDVRDIRLDDIPRPVPPDGDILVQVKAVGVCGSDLHSYLEGSTTGRTKVVPYVLGHELAGIIPPEFAKQSGLAAGTLVAVDPARPCMNCEWCHRGHTNLCPHVRFLGYAPTNGALAEFVSVAPSALHPVPPRSNRRMRRSWRRSASRSMPFDLVMSRLGIDVETKLIDIQDATAADIGRCAGRPVSWRILPLVQPDQRLAGPRGNHGEVLVLETHLDFEDLAKPAMVFYPDRELGGDPNQLVGAEPGRNGSPFAGGRLRKGAVRAKPARKQPPRYLPRLQVGGELPRACGRGSLIRVSRNQCPIPKFDRPRPLPMLSSLRKQGPTFSTAHALAARWVPAFAGTTL